VPVRRTLRALSTVLIVAGVLVLADAITTLVWQEPITALTTKVKQDDLSGELDRLRARLPPPVELQALRGLHTTARRVAFAARSWDRQRKPGDPVGRIEIPKIGASFVIVKGTAQEDLREGPGIYDSVPFPGAPGTTAIAGHRTTYLAPFRHIDELKPGNRIVIEMPYATLTYAVETTKIVQPTDLAVIARAGFDRLVLTACHPLFSAAERIVVFSRLVRTVPKGVAA